MTLFSLNEIVSYDDFKKVLGMKAAAREALIEMVVEQVATPNIERIRTATKDPNITPKEGAEILLSAAIQATRIEHALMQQLQNAQQMPGPEGKPN